MSNRTKQILFLVNEEEEEIIRRKMKEAGMNRLSVYFFLCDIFVSLTKRSFIVTAPKPVD